MPSKYDASIMRNAMWERAKRRLTADAIQDFKDGKLLWSVLLMMNTIDERRLIFGPARRTS